SRCMEPVTVPAAPQNVSFITDIVASRSVEVGGWAASGLRAGFRLGGRRRGERRGFAGGDRAWLGCTRGAFLENRRSPGGRSLTVAARIGVAPRVDRKPQP